MPRKKENKTVELIIGISFMLGGYIALVRMPNEITIQQGIIHGFVTIVTVLCVLTAGYMMFYFAWIHLRTKIQGKHFSESNYPFLPVINPKKRKTKKQFLTPTEKEFKKFLRQNLPENIEIHCKVRLADILKEETTYRRIIMMHVDYVLLDEATQEPILVIELDDNSHNTPDARERDAIKDAALKESGIKCTRISVDKKYHPTIIKEIVKYCIKKTT